MIGQTLGPYKIGDQLGAGGMGEVYAAVDTRLDRTVAIKVLPEHLANDRRVRERFEREARAVSSLNHPHICTLFDVGEQDGVNFLVMELVEGDTLQQRLEKKGRLPLDQALEYAIQIADALDKAHRQGIVHRDLKPGNIMITKSAGVKLLDFGLAKLKGNADDVSPLSQMATEDPSAPLTAEGTIIGTLQYMAPEQLEAKEADARTDIFAFGAVVYEMVTGKRAFAGETQASLIGAILKDEPGSMAEFETLTPASLDHVIGRCVRKDPDQRWQTAADLMHELTWVRAAKPVALEAPGPGTKRRLIAVALATLAAGALTTAVAFRILSPEPSVDVFRGAVEVHEGGSLGRPDRRPYAPTFELSPDGRKLVYVWNDGEGRQLYLLSLNQYQAVPIPGTEGARYPSFSPDGQEIVFFRSGELMRVEVDGGEPRTISGTGLDFAPDGPILSRVGFVWTDDDTILMTSAMGVLQVPANSGVVTNLTRDPPDGYGQGFAQLLEGGAVLYAEGKSGGVPSEESTVFVESLETGERITVVEGGTDPTYVDSGHIVFVRSGKMMAVPFDAATREVTGDPVVVLEDLMQAENAAIAGDNLGIGQYSISDSGTFAYLPGGIVPDLLQFQLYWVDLDGNAEPFPLSPSTIVTARFSPDGNRLVYVEGTPGEDRSTWVYNMALGSSSVLPKPSLEHENDLHAWSPDGTKIVFSSRIGDGPFNLWLTAADGSGEPERLTESDSYQFPASWSSNGDLAFLEASSTTDSLDIMVLSMDGDSEPTPFHPTTSMETHPAFSPDGNWLAYRSNRTGRQEVYVRPFPAGEAGAVLVSNAGGSAPAWSPNGEQLFYRAGQRFMVVDFPGGSISAHTPPRILFEATEPTYVGDSPTAPRYDLSPIGDRFVLASRVLREPKPITQINIILNWVEELKELLPVP